MLAWCCIFALGVTGLNLASRIATTLDPRTSLRITRLLSSLGHDSFSCRGALGQWVQSDGEHETLGARGFLL